MRDAKQMTYLEKITEDTEPSTEGQQGGSFEGKNSAMPSNEKITSSLNIMEVYLS